MYWWKNQIKKSIEKISLFDRVKTKKNWRKRKKKRKKEKENVKTRKRTEWKKNKKKHRLGFFLLVELLGYSNTYITRTFWYFLHRWELFCCYVKKNKLSKVSGLRYKILYASFFFFPKKKTHDPTTLTIIKWSILYIKFYYNKIYTYKINDVKIQLVVFLSLLLLLLLCTMHYYYDYLNQ